MLVLIAVAIAREGSETVAGARPVATRRTPRFIFPFGFAGFRSSVRDLRTSSDSIPVLKEITETHLSRFETRKIAFSDTQIPLFKLSGLTEAAHFELLWLKNKQNYYTSLEGYHTDKTQLY